MAFTPPGPPPTALVDEVVVHDGGRTIVAQCPHGRTVRHGGGRVGSPLEHYLGSRVSHVSCCIRYVLTLRSAS